MPMNRRALLLADRFLEADLARWREVATAANIRGD